VINQLRTTNMAEQVVYPEEAEVKLIVSPSTDVKQRSLVLLLTIVALASCSLELEFLERLDGMRLYMTPGEILWDASVALLVLFGATIGWWLCLLLIARIMDMIPAIARHSKSVFWYVGLAIPLPCFAFTVCNAVRLRVYPQWHPGPFAFLLLTLTALVLCGACLWMTPLRALQRFCSTRVAPIGWLHVIFAAAAVIALGAHGVHIFHDFVDPVRAVGVSGHPDVYLITVDALRADDTSLYGYSRPTTPNLKRFAQRAFTFDYFFANANFTSPATTSIETGKLPWTNRTFHQGGYLRGPAKQENLPNLLRQRGYYTAMITSNYFASPFHHRTQGNYDAVGLVGFGGDPGIWFRYTNLAGFNTEYTLSGPLLKPLTILRRYLDAPPWSSRYAGPEVVFDYARPMVEQRDNAQPGFVWTHILPPHDPYVPPPAYRGRFLSGNKLTRKYDFIGLRTDAPPPGTSVAEMRARYDEQICYADQLIGDFLDWLDQTGRLDRSVVIIAADHGESFEHNWLTHAGPYLYNSLIHVPLLIHLPGQKQGSRITQMAEQVDLLPTILDLVGSQIPSWSEGISLVPVLEGKPLPQRLLFSMNLERNSIFEPITQGTVAVIDEDFKYIEQLGTHDVSLYRYRTDPLENQNLIESEPAVASRMSDLLAKKLREVNSQALPRP
jgi:arylsulfatase A-like enzyme